MENVEPTHEVETAAAGLSDILNDQSSSAAVEQQAPQPEAPKAAEPAPEPAQAAETPKDEDKGPFWYRKAVEKERKARQELERKLQELQQREPQAQGPQFSDPVQYLEYTRTIDRLERSEDRFIDKHGEDTFEEVRAWLSTRPDIEQWAQQQRHPWGAAHEQYQREKLSAEIGNDPNAWREKETARIREQLLKEMGGAQVPMAQPRAPIPAPASGQRSVGSRSGPEWSGPRPIGSILKG